MKVADMNKEELVSAFAKAHMATYTGGFLVRGDLKMSADIFNEASAQLLIQRYRLAVDPDEANWYVSYTPSGKSVRTAEGYRANLPEAVIECVVEIILGKDVSI